ncbi:MAG: hypothetical protein R6V83_11730 [Candidatus Thorarchaeota archaeon]
MLIANLEGINNPRIPKIFVEGTNEDKEAFIGALIPQDGTISGNKISWTHSNVLHAGDKTKAYGFEPKVGKREIELIKEHGKEEEHAWALRLGKLDELEESDSKEIAKTTTSLRRIVDENPNHFIVDEVSMVESLGISVRVKAYTIRYHKRSGRVSVEWRAEPKTLYESIKLGIIAPPNDVKKREKMAEIIRSKLALRDKAIIELENNGMDVNEWWKKN